jgi:hypothetical protein
MKKELIAMAHHAGRGVIEAALIPVNEIEVVDQLAMICRNPGRSRPSMSGFGVNVTKLKEIAGWNNAARMGIGKGEEQPLGAVYGLILIG